MSPLSELTSSCINLSPLLVLRWRCQEGGPAQCFLFGWLFNLFVSWDRKECFLGVSPKHGKLLFMSH